MKNNKKIILIISIIVFFIIAYQAIAIPVIDLKINPEYKINETIILNYAISSDIEGQIDYIADISCPSAPHSQLELKTAILQPNKPLMENFTYLTVDDRIEPQTCDATVSILEPYNIFQSKQIKIITNPSFEFEFRQCKDSLCNFEAEVFEFNKEVYLDYFSNVNEISAHAKLIYPDKTSTEIKLPTSIKASQIGTYTLDITASKQGYKTIHKTEQFAVIEKETPIKDASLCNGNNICDNKETYQNCPQDCPTGIGQIFSSDANQKKSTTNSLSENYLIYVISTAIIIIFISAMFLIIKKYRNQN